MGNGKWETANGKRPVGNGQWETANGKRQNGKRQPYKRAVICPTGLQSPDEGDG